MSVQAATRSSQTRHCFHLRLCEQSYLPTQFVFSRADARLSALYHNCGVASYIYLLLLRCSVDSIDASEESSSVLLNYVADLRFTILVLAPCSASYANWRANSGMTARSYAEISGTLPPSREVKYLFIIFVYNLEK